MCAIFKRCRKIQMNQRTAPSGTSLSQRFGFKQASTATRSKFRQPFPSVGKRTCMTGNGVYDALIGCWGRNSIAQGLKPSRGFEMVSHDRDAWEQGWITLMCYVSWPSVPKFFSSWVAMLSPTNIGCPTDVIPRLIRL